MISTDDYILHVGVGHLDGGHSGRFEWGSGDKAYQRATSFLAMVNGYKQKGFDEKMIADIMQLGSVRNLRARVTYEGEAARSYKRAKAKEMYYDQAIKPAEIARIMGENDSTVRSWLNAADEAPKAKAREVADILKAEVANKKYLDVGKGIEQQFEGNVSSTKLEAALNILKDEGYNIQNIYVKQANNPGLQNTTVKVLTKDDVTIREIYENRDKIQSIDERYEGNESDLTARNMKKPVSVDLNRIAVRYGTGDGTTSDGTMKDGVIEIRPGVPDLSLGGGRYAQVRIAVNDTHYIKGMAVYNPDLPPGVDILFNTNKSAKVPIIGDTPDAKSVLKPFKRDKETGEIDWDNPFGATIKKQPMYTDKDGKDKQTCINIVNEDEDWNRWAKTLPAQFLSKQLPSLAKQQLNLKYDSKLLEFKEIEACTNPTIKKELLKEFADSCDSAAVHLKAAALPRQAAHVLLPVNSLKENEVYAPGYSNGEQVALVRYPHGGIFEIPILTVNNNNKEGKSVIGADSRRAIGIHHTAAEQLSGADFDGDTAVVIPLSSATIKSKKIKELLEFEPKIVYAAYDGMPKTCKENGFDTQTEMGKITNLITDMTALGAPEDKLIRAVKHSMVVIDAEKHNLDYRTSYKVNDIDSLKKEFQVKDKGRYGGAATLISKASSEAHPYDRKEIGIDPNTGDKLYLPTGKTKPHKTTKVDENGNAIWDRELVTINSTKMYEAKDARELLSKNPNQMELIYADYANKQKNLAREARKLLANTGDIEYNPSAAKTYKSEVESLKSKYSVYLAHKPQERKAQLVTSKYVEAKVRANPDMEYSEKKKIANQALSRARKVISPEGSYLINITEKEYSAIQSGAVHKSFLKELINGSDKETIKSLATPRNDNRLTKYKLQQANNMRKRGFTWDEISNAVGLSVSTLQKEL